MKATHRLKENHNTSYFDVSTESDRDGWFVAKRIDGDYWHYGFVREKEIEPIPAPAPRRPFDYESWRALLKQHGGNVWVRIAENGDKASHYMGTVLLSDLANGHESITSIYEYSTDFGDTWHEMSRP